jgi:RNA polymerase sigma factor (sigma-70 family)
MENGVILHSKFNPVNGMGAQNKVEGDPLWDSFKQGNAGAFEKIFKTYYASLLSYGLRLNADDDEVKDCIQILFLNIWERREFLSASDSIKNYLLASLRRLILKRMKSGPSFVELDSDNTSFHIELSVESKIIHDQTLRDNVNFLQSAIHRLPDRQKEALYLKFYNDQSFADIATVMNISTRAVYKLIYKALDSLNEELTPQTRNVPLVISTFVALLCSAGEILAPEMTQLSAFLEII